MLGLVPASATNFGASLASTFPNIGSRGRGGGMGEVPITCPLRAPLFMQFPILCPVFQRGCRALLFSYHALFEKVDMLRRKEGKYALKNAAREGKVVARGKRARRKRFFRSAQHFEKIATPRRACPGENFARSAQRPRRAPR